MKSASETLLKNAEDQVEAAREDQAEPSTTLVELGRVTETKGGWLGAKFDTGAGLMFY